MTDAARGWDASAAAWIARLGETGDFGRRYVLDAPMIARLREGTYRTALDVGCGEGRFCRVMARHGIRTVGIDPTDALIARARDRDPAGDYRVEHAETMRVPPASFDLVVSYLSLIDIPDIATALNGMVAALKPGGSLLIANLNPFATAAGSNGWTADPDGEPRFLIDRYLEERADWVSWGGLHIQNWHRPLETYMALLLAQGLVLRHFSEPAPEGGEPATADRYRRVPYFHIMEWLKPAS